VRIAVAGLCALAVIALAYRVGLPPDLRLVLGWDAFAVAMLAQAWLIMRSTPAAHIRERAQSEDASGTVITLLMLAAATTSFLVVAFGHPPAGVNGLGQGLHLGSMVLAVISAWLLIHTVFAFHYAHLFYRSAGPVADQPQAGGLTFPRTPEPTYLDFAYFSLVVGMTFQVSDVQITDRRLRMTVLAHSLLSFLFSTVIIALTVNLLLTIREGR
jgi:uncharacterized membrane protein